MWTRIVLTVNPNIACHEVCMVVRGSKQFWLQKTTHHSMLQGILQVLRILNTQKNPSYGDQFCPCPKWTIAACSSCSAVKSHTLSFMRVHNGLRNYSILLFCRQRADHKVKHTTFEITEGMLGGPEESRQCRKKQSCAQGSCGMNPIRAALQA